MPLQENRDIEKVEKNMKIKRKLCRPCAEKLKETHSIEQITFGRDEKVDCFKCKRHKFGHTYITEKKVTK